MILEQQKLINEKTKELDKIKLTKGGFERREIIRLNKLADSQEELAGEGNLQWVLVKLKEEEEEVFAYVVSKIIDDMKSVADFLREQKTGSFTQGIQEEIVKKLELLLETFRRTKDEYARRRPDQGGQGGGRPPFVPPKAKLRLLRVMQKELRDRTERFEKTFSKKGEDLSPAEKAFSRKLMDEQGALAGLTRKVKETVQSKAGMRGAPPGEPDEEDEDEFEEEDEEDFEEDEDEF
jgi:hypothetical protein